MRRRNKGRIEKGNEDSGLDLAEDILADSET